MRGAAAPELLDAESFGFMRRIGVAMFLVGAASLMGILPLPDPDTSDHPAIRVVALLLALGGVSVWLVRTYRPWVMRLSVYYGILLISVLMAVTRPIGATPFFYLWPILFAAYFFTRRGLAGVLALMWVSMAVGLFGWSNDPTKGIMFFGTAVSVTLAAIVVSVLREHLTAVIGQLELASATDYLTGLLNRRAFDLELQRQLARARRSETELSLVTFDLDHFKQINDRLGHAAGDRALCEFAGLLVREQRSGDTLARVGGEEFAVVLFGAGPDDAVAFAERIGAELAVLPGLVAPLSASAGVATLGDGEHAAETLLVEADRALYGAKSAGRHRVAQWRDGGIRVGEPIAALASTARAA
jgi:diguanylate cyclase (GGDEF)-like protein